VQWLPFAFLGDILAHSCRPNVIILCSRYSAPVYCSHLLPRLVVSLNMHMNMKLVACVRRFVSDLVFHPAFVFRPSSFVLFSSCACPLNWIEFSMPRACVLCVVCVVPLPVSGGYGVCFLGDSPLSSVKRNSMRNLMFVHVVKWFTMSRLQ